jgi:general stress protein CsbA
MASSLLLPLAFASASALVLSMALAILCSVSSYMASYHAPESIACIDAVSCTVGQIKTIAPFMTPCHVILEEIVFQ